MQAASSYHLCKHVATCNDGSVFEAGADVIGSMAGYHKKLDAIRPTPYLDECCRVLEETQEFASDGHLVHLVRLQLLRERIAFSFPHELSGAQLDFGGLAGASMKMLQRDLTDLKRSAPIQFQYQGGHIGGSMEISKLIASSVTTPSPPGYRASTL